MRLVEGQFWITFARLIYRHAEVISGSYKKQKISHGTISSGGPELTDDEKLTHTMGIMQRHVELMQDCINHIGKEKDDV